MRCFLLALTLVATACGTTDPPPVIVIPNTTPATAARIDPAGHWPGYWRPGWRHVANSHCDTRGMVLTETAGPTARDTNGDGCADNGLVRDAYADKVVPASATEIDHVYPLRRAWDRGAHAWPRDKWIIFANWRPNLLPTTLNGNKGDAMPGEWEPPTPLGKCAYTVVIRNTAKVWQLPLTSTEQRALDALYASCG